MIVPFPDRKILRPRMVDPWIDAKSVGGGPSLTGSEQVISVSAGIWRYAMSGIDVQNNQQVKEFRRFMSAMDGRANTTLVPFFERARAPWPVDSVGRVLNPKLIRKPELDRTQFKDSPTLVDELISARSSGNAVGDSIASVFGTDLVIEMLPVVKTIDNQSTTFNPTLPVAGDVFSIGSFAYVITEIIALIGAKATVRVRPPLRTAVPLGVAINFTSPAVEMRFISDSQARMPLDLWKFSTPSLEFVEAV